MIFERFHIRYSNPLFNKKLTQSSSKYLAIKG